MPATARLAGLPWSGETFPSRWARRGGFCYDFGYLIRLVQECAFRAHREPYHPVRGTPSSRVRSSGCAPGGAHGVRACGRGCGRADRAGGKTRPCGARCHSQRSGEPGEPSRGALDGVVSRSRGGDTPAGRNRRCSRGRSRGGGQEACGRWMAASASLPERWRGRRRASKTRPRPHSNQQPWRSHRWLRRGRAGEMRRTRRPRPAQCCRSGHGRHRCGRAPAAAAHGAKEGLRPAAAGSATLGQTPCPAATPALPQVAYPSRCERCAGRGRRPILAQFPCRPPPESVAVLFVPGGGRSGACSSNVPPVVEPDGSSRPPAAPQDGKSAGGRVRNPHRGPFPANPLMTAGIFGTPVEPGEIATAFAIDLGPAGTIEAARTRWTAYWS